MVSHYSSLKDDPENIAVAHCLTGKGGARAQVDSALILVVDERLDIRDMLQHGLTIVGYRVATLAQEAWTDHIALSYDPPALVILDMSDPSVDVVAFLRDLRRRWTTTPPILVMTTSPSIYTKVEEVGQVVLKPFRIRDLLEKIQSVVLSGGDSS